MALSDLLIILLVAVAWVFLQRVVFPKLGIPS